MERNGKAALRILNAASTFAAQNNVARLEDAPSAHRTENCQQDHRTDEGSENAHDVNASDTCIHIQ